MSRAWPWARFALGLIALALSATFLLLAAWSVAPVLLGNRSANLIVSDSMQPGFGRGDVVLTVPSDGRDLGPPTVILFDSPSGRIIHRIHRALPDGRYETKGDANADPDTDLVDPDQVVGTGRVVLPGIAWGLLWFREGRIGLAVAWVVAVVTLLWMARWGSSDRYDPWLLEGHRAVEEPVSTAGSASPARTDVLPG